MPLLSSIRRRLGGTKPAMQDWPGLIEGYRKWLPVSDRTPVITLREGALQGTLQMALPTLAVVNRWIGPEWSLDGRLMLDNRSQILSQP